jgi:phage gp16-like protein
MNALAAIHVGKKALRLEDEDYRALLERVTGKRSAKDLSAAELGNVLAEMRRLGFAPASSPPRASARRATGHFAAKLQALWIAGYNLGIVQNRDDAAMLAFVERQTGLSHTRFLTDSDDARKAIEALKAWLAREGKVDWSPIDLKRTGLPKYVNLPQFRIVRAQQAKLGAASAPPDARDFRTFSGSDWIVLMNALGTRVRAAVSRKRAAA